MPACACSFSMSGFHLRCVFGMSESFSCCCWFARVAFRGSRLATDLPFCLGLRVSPLKVALFTTLFYFILFLLFSGPFSGRG